MNENLNARIKNLFLNIIKHPEKITGVDGNKISFGDDIAIRYWNKGRNEKVTDNEPLKLKSSTMYYWDCFVDVVDHLVFSIETPYRQYRVPDFIEIMEYATVVDTINRGLAKFEEKKISEYERCFSIYDPDYYLTQTRKSE